MNLTPEEDLLIQSYITTAFLVELKNNDFLNSDYYKKMQFEDKFIKDNLNRIKIDNHGTLVIMMYTMLVIPKELIFRDFSTEVSELNKIVHKLKSESKSSYSYDSKGIDYVKHIRNAVAHARVDFKLENSVTFTDTDEKKKQECTITIPLDKFGDFLTGLQSIFAKYVESIKNKHLHNRIPKE